MNFLEELWRAFTALAGIIHLGSLVFLAATGVWWLLDRIKGKKDGPR